MVQLGAPHRDPRPIRVSIFLSTEEWLALAELAELRKYGGTGDRGPSLLARSIVLREIAHAESRLDRGVPDVSPTRKHAREGGTRPTSTRTSAVAVPVHLPPRRGDGRPRKPWQCAENTSANRSGRGPQ